MHTNIQSIENVKTNQHTVTAPNLPGMAALVAGVLVLWLALVAFLAGQGDLTGSPGTPPLGILLSAVVPVIVFLAAFRLSQSFRNFVLTFDLCLAAGIQAWRFAGLGFLALYANGVLPGVFAWPAGIGDMAVGMTAPWVMLALIKRPEFAGGNFFMFWNLFGMLDLIMAVGTGGLSAMLAHGTPGEITMAPMSHLPLALIPAYFVPILFMLHLTALFQRKHLVASIGNPERAI
jgi:hypothetical protein